MDIATRDSPNGTNHRSAMLQDMIKEKRAQTSRSGRSRELSGETLAGEAQSSPLSGASSGNRLGTQRRNSGMGSITKSAPKEMGLREMQEVSTSLALKRPQLTAFRSMFPSSTNRTSISSLRSFTDANAVKS